MMKYVVTFILILALFSSIGFLGFSPSYTFGQTFMSFTSTLQSASGQVQNVFSLVEKLTGTSLIGSGIRLTYYKCNPNVGLIDWTPGVIGNKSTGQIVRLTLPKSHYVSSSLSLAHDTDYHYVVLYFYVSGPDSSFYDQTSNKLIISDNFQLIYACGHMSSSTAFNFFTYGLVNKKADLTKYFTSASLKFSDSKCISYFTYINPDNVRYSYEFEFNISDISQVYGL